MNVGIVGAGLAGLGASYELARRGISSLVFEKSHTIGGRCATRKVGDFLFDSGATSVAPGESSLEHVILEELDRSELVLVPKPIHLHQALRTYGGDPKRAKTRYTYRNGMATLAKLLGQTADVQLNTQIDALERREGKLWFKAGEREFGPFDHVVLTPPIPQTAQLLWTVGESRPFANVRYRPCLSILLGYDIEPPDVPYHAILDPEQRHPLTWLSLESVKCPERPKIGGTALVAQMSPAYSHAHYSAEESFLVSDAASFIARLYGEHWSKPAVSSVKVWKYSQPETVARFESVNRAGEDIWIASDGIVSPRLEGAYEAGLRAAFGIFASLDSPRPL